MIENPLHTAIIEAARELFAVRSYHQVTVREIATIVGVSPAKVMKVVGSKEALFRDAATFEPETLPLDVPRSEIGRMLVRRILDRHRLRHSEPLARGLYLSMTGPDQQAVRERFTAAYLGQFTELCGGSDGEHRAGLIVCTLLGLVAGHAFELVGTPEREAVIADYGDLVQRLIDG